MISRQYNTLESLKVMGQAPQKALGPNINVLLWNVFKCKKDGWHDNFVSLQKNKDLVLLQEAILNSRFDIQFSASIEHQWIMARSFKNLRSDIETGVKTGSRVAAIEYKLAASAHGEPITKTKKMSLASLYPLYDSQQQLLVINAHLINFVPLDKFIAHLNVVFEALNTHQGPVLLAGDFNTWNKPRLKYLQALADSFSLSEVKVARRARIKHLFKHLDHIYCRGLQATNVRVHTNIHTSDHYPISLTIRPIL
jgi:endonuclease/exonuclease/phosphatase (EEP) superfamily protein YafD